MLRYLSYDNLNIDEELAKIEKSDSAEIVLDQRNKKCLFILGMLFVNGVKLKVLNGKELGFDNFEFEETNKSFNMMSYVWEKLSDDNFPSPDYSNVNTDIEKRIENTKRLGVRNHRIEDKPTNNKIFLICPVRNATPEQRTWIEEFVRKKCAAGYTIHAPHLHTRQKDLFGGYAICTQNAEAVASSQEIDIYYDQSSTGSVFDLGVAYALHKPLKLLNKEEIVFNDSDIIDSIIKEWPFNEKLNRRELLIELFSKSWSAETCSPGLRDEWTEENPSLGQCAITALILNDCFGGQIMRCMASSGSHYYNMIDGELVDLTVEQFQGEIPDYEHGEERTREYLLGNEDTKKRYRELLGKVRSAIIDKNIDIMWTNQELNKYKALLNQYYMFTDYEILRYSKDAEFEYAKIDLAAQNTGLIIHVKHNLQTDEFTCDIDRTIYPIPDEYFRTVFKVARQYQEHIRLEKQLTDAYVASTSPKF